MGFIGYVTNWSTTGAIVNGTTRRATTYATDGLIAKPRIYTQTNGVKVHFDGITTALTSPGQVTQEFFDTGGVTAIDALRSNLGAVGTLTMTPVSGSTTTATAILVRVEDTTPVQGSRARVWCSCTWEILTTWS
jgi:hypothetical protein